MSAVPPVRLSLADAPSEPPATLTGRSSVSDGDDSEVERTPRGAPASPHASCAPCELATGRVKAGPKRPVCPRSRARSRPYLSTPRLPTRRISPLPGQHQQESKQQAEKPRAGSAQGAAPQAAAGPDHLQGAPVVEDDDQHQAGHLFHRRPHLRRGAQGAGAQGLFDNDTPGLSTRGFADHARALIRDLHL